VPETTRVFLSYGVRDASDVADRLHRDLTSRGYKIWQDVNRIRTGWPWDNEVQDGLQNSDVVLALLSPHSVRRARGPGNATKVDSVCLDELAYARFECKIPIVPVKVEPCEAPFLIIYRLQQIDFRRWQESEAVYKDGLERICGAIQTALHGDQGERSWGTLPEPQDFTLFLEEKRADFTGRQWFFQRIEDWRVNSTQPALLITGGPGVGKSAVIAALIHDNPSGAVLAYHCCRADTPATLEPANFVSSLAAMLSARLEEYAEILKDRVIGKSLENVQTDPANAFEKAILAPLKKLHEPAVGRRLLLIDALDEALTHRGRPTIVEMLAMRLAFLPPWLRIVATTRSEHNVLNQLRELRALELSAENPLSQDDLREFILFRLSKPTLREKALAAGMTPTELATSLFKASAGNFLFVATVLNAVDGEQINFGDIEKLPPRLGSLYEIFFNRLFSFAGVNFSSSRCVLEAVVAAREPLNREQVAAASGLDAEGEVQPILARLASFLPYRDGAYVLFHRSLFEWLTEWDRQRDQPIAGPYHVSLKNGRSRLVEACCAEYERGPGKASLYCLRHLPIHLHDIGRSRDARKVLLNFAFLRARLERFGPNALIRECDFFPEDADLRTLESAIRLSAHVLAQKPCQLPAQLTGHLFGNSAPKIQALLKEAGEETTSPWLRPMTGSLQSEALHCTLFGHADYVSSVVVTSDGRMVVSASGDSNVIVWDLESGRRLHTLKAHTRPLVAVVVTSDSLRIVSGDLAGALIIWDLDTGKQLHQMKDHTEPIKAIAVSSDSRKAVSASGDKSLKIWDLNTGKCLRALIGHEDEVTDVIVTPEGHVVSASKDTTLRVWNLKSGEEIAVLGTRNWATRTSFFTLAGKKAFYAGIRGTIYVRDAETRTLITTLPGHTDAVDRLALSPDGQKLISASRDGTLKIWELQSGTELRTLSGHTAPVTALAVSPDGRVLSGSIDKTIRIWDIDTGEEQFTLRGHSFDVFGIAVTPDGERAISASNDNTLRIWDLKKGRELITLREHTAAVREVTISPNGRRAISASNDNTLRIWDLDQLEAKPKNPRHIAPVNAIAVTPNGLLSVTAAGAQTDIASKDNTLKVWNLRNGNELRTLSGHLECVRAVAVTHDGRRAISASADKALIVWNLKTGGLLHTLRGHRDGVCSLAITPDGCKVISASFDHMVIVWDLASGQLVHLLSGHTDWVNRVAVTRDGRWAVSTSADATIKIWDLLSGKESRTLRGHEGQAYALAVAADGRTVISGGADATVRTWSLDGTNLKTLRGHTDIITAIAITPDGKHAVSASGFKDGTVRVWNISTGKQLHVLSGHTAYVTALGCTSDSRRVVSASMDATVRLWDLAGSVELAEFVGQSPIHACELAPDDRTIIAGERSGKVHFLRIEGLVLRSIHDQV
jgi:WD40 repeat protein